MSEIIIHNVEKIIIKKINSLEKTNFVSRHITVHYDNDKIFDIIFFSKNRDSLILKDIKTIINLKT